jgi:hypothetical protein
LLTAADELPTVNDGFAYDLVDVTHQAMNFIFTDYAALTVAAYDTLRNQSRDSTLLRPIGDALLQLIEDQDAILSSDRNFLLGNWIGAARYEGRSEAEKDQNEFNARDVITVSFNTPTGPGSTAATQYDYDYGTNNIHMTMIAVYNIHMTMIAVYNIHMTMIAVQTNIHMTMIAVQTNIHLTMIAVQKNIHMTMIAVQTNIHMTMIAVQTPPQCHQFRDAMSTPPPPTHAVERKPLK